MYIPILQVTDRALEGIGTHCKVIEKLIFSECSITKYALRAVTPVSIECSISKYALRAVTPITC